MLELMGSYELFTEYELLLANKVNPIKNEKNNFSEIDEDLVLNLLNFIEEYRERYEKIQVKEKNEIEWIKKASAAYFVAYFNYNVDSKEIKKYVKNVKEYEIFLEGLLTKQFRDNLFTKENEVEENQEEYDKQVALTGIKILSFPWLVAQKDLLHLIKQVFQSKK